MQLDLLQKDSSSPQDATAAPRKKPTPPASHKVAPPPVVKNQTAQQPEAPEHASDEKAPSAFKTISEAANILGVPQHVLRFWEGRFSQIKPLKLRGGRRYYRPEDMEILTTIQNLLYKQGYTIKGAKKAFSSRTQAPAVETPVVAVPAAAAAPAPKAKLELSEKQKSQIANLREELLGLQNVLKPYVF